LPLHWLPGNPQSVLNVHFPDTPTIDTIQRNSSLLWNGFLCGRLSQLSCLLRINPLATMVWNAAVAIDFFQQTAMLGYKVWRYCSLLQILLPPSLQLVDILHLPHIFVSSNLNVADVTDLQFFFTPLRAYHIDLFCLDNTRLNRFSSNRTWPW
jgi:hypothetical protein